MKLANLGESLAYYFALLRRSPLATIGIILTAVVAILVAAAPLYIPYPQDVGAQVHLGSKFLPPSWIHPFGTDELGRDVFSRVMWGGQITMVMGLGVIALSVAIGVPIGLVSGMMGGRTDVFLMRLTDAFLAMPTILLALVIAAATQGGELGAIVAVASTAWAFHARLVRGQVMKIKSEPFVEAAVITGVNKRRMLAKYLLPNTLTIIIVQSTIQYGLSLLFVGTLGFLGLGVPPPAPEWGILISLGRGYLQTAWWISVFPGLLLFIGVLATSLLGDGLRDVVDPRTRI